MTAITTTIPALSPTPTLNLSQNAMSTSGGSAARLITQLAAFKPRAKTSGGSRTPGAHGGLTAASSKLRSTEATASVVSTELPRKWSGCECEDATHATDYRVA